MSEKQRMRPSYFEGQYLGAEDLAAAVDYERLSAARHALGAHTWGIAIGLYLKEVPDAAGNTQIFVAPGYGWDGFGRPIVVLSPAVVPASLFQSILYDPLIDEPSGRFVPVWIRYREVATNAPAEGFENCRTGEQNARVFETFLIEAGDRTLEEQRSKVLVMGQQVLAEEAFKALDAADPLIPDRSIPHQTFPEPGGRERWLLPLGRVRWKPNPLAGQPGSFQPSTAAEQGESARLRVLIGAVAESIQGPEGKVRLKRRTDTPSAVNSDDVVWVEGNLRVQGDVRPFGKSIDLVDVNGQNNGVPLQMSRSGDGAAGSRQMRLRIGSAEAGVNRLEVGPETGAGFQAKFAVRDDGRVGVGTTDPGAMLELRGGDLLMKATADDPGDIVFQNSGGLEKARVWSKPTAGAGLHLSAGGTTPHMMIDDAGRVGIGTTTPNRAVTIAGGGGRYLNVKADDGAFEVLLGADANGGIVSTMTNHDLQLRAGVNNTYMTVKAGGNVGVGTTNAAVKLHVEGNRIRLTNGAKQIDLRADGAAVDLESPTDDLHLRSSGPPGKNRILMNTFAPDGFVGIGTQAPECKLHVANNLNEGAGNVNAHVAALSNTNVMSNADVLALQVGAPIPGVSNNFVTFFGGAGAVGSIAGNGAGGVTYNTTGADFAELLPVAEGETPLEEGEVVGIAGGVVSRRIGDSAMVSAISARPALLGGCAGEGRQAGARVGFIGQIPVRVRGPVRAGQLVLPSGEDDGVAVAMTAEEAAETGATQVIGVAWQSSSEIGVKLIRTAIGMCGPLLQLMQAKLARLKTASEPA